MDFGDYYFLWPYCWQVNVLTWEITWKMITWLEVNEGDEDGGGAQGVNVTVFNQCGLQCFHFTNDPVKTVLLH